MSAVLASAVSAVAMPPSQTLVLIAELAHSLASSIDLQATLSKAVERIAAAMQAEAASVFLFDAAQDALVCQASSGPADVLGLQLERGTGVVSRVFNTGIGERLLDATQDPDFDADVDASTGFVTRSMLCTPLYSGRGIIGVLQVLNKRDGLPFDESDQLLLSALAAPAALAISNARLAVESLERARMHRELSMARRMQRSLLPRRRRDGFPLLALNRPAQEISGDFYDFFELADGRIGFTIGDVAGKGLDAAFLMVRCASLMRWAGKEGLSPAVWMARVNEEMCQTLGNGSFICAVAGYFDRASRVVVWANAGFPPLIEVHHDRVTCAHRAEGPPVGIVSGMTFPEQSATLEGDAALYLFSDGATDARDGNGVLLGVSGMQALIEKHAGWRPETRLRRIVGELRRLQLHDDTTLMLIGGASA